MRTSVVPLLLAVCTFACGGRAADTSEPPLPQVSGSLTLDGLSQPVRVVRDAWGVAHLYAQTERDLFFAQGFVQAQDRLFQMDLWRRSAQGRLSEVLGPNFVERDAMTRRVQYQGDLGAEWASYGDDVRSIAESFVRGVNASVALARDRLPEPFRTAGWRPEPWKPEDLLNRTDAFLASGDAELEVIRARLVAAVGERAAAALLPIGAPPKVPRGLDVDAVSFVVLEALRRVGTPPFFAGLLSRDPHVVELPNPSRRYLVHLNAPGWNVIGATFPWLPGVAFGHNERVAWSMRPFEADTEDLFVERVNPANPHQVSAGGRWVNTTIVKDPIVIRGRAKAFDFEREYTPNGVVIASDTERHLVYVLKWSGTEPGAAGELAAIGVDRAQSLGQVREALARWKMPAVAVTAADADGRRDDSIAALVPIREGWNGVLPAPGWTRTARWRGWMDPAALGGRAKNDPSTVPLIVNGRPASPAVADARDQFAVWLRRHVGERPRKGDTVAFTNVVAVTAAARSRFTIGPFTLNADPGPLVAIDSDPHDWDRSIAMNAPGQSELPGSAYLDDFAKAWVSGHPVPLAFSGAAVAQHAETTLVLSPRVRHRP